MNRSTHRNTLKIGILALAPLAIPRAHRQSPHLCLLESIPEVRAIPSVGVTRLHRHYDPFRIPRRAAPRVSRTLEFASTRPGPLPHSPRSLSLHAVPITPVDPYRCTCRFFPVGAAFPVIQAGRHPRFHFRGLLRLHARYGLQGRSTTQGGLCHRASTRPVTGPSCLPATRLTDYYLEGSFTHR
jgi:hypothetical protein